MLRLPAVVSVTDLWIGIDDRLRRYAVGLLGDWEKDRPS